jgi:hypothetical protein
MRKLMLTVVASCALVAVMPAAALAHGRHHRKHHARIHHKTFGSDFNQSSSSTTSSGDTAGTVQSFTGGVLTILLNDGKTTVSGQVTSATEIECRAAEPASTSGTSGSGTSGSGTSSWQGHDHGGNWGDDNGQGDDENAQNCDPTTALVQGATVREALLSLTSAGAVWGKIELVTQSTSSSASTSSSSSSSGSCNGSGQH